jgi:hypothetical protein
VNQAVPEKLPLWRLCAAIFILGGMVAVLLFLAPVYLDNLRLGSYVRYIVQSPAALSTPDETIRNWVLGRARELNLPVEPGEIQITHPAGKLQVQMKYAVVRDFHLYQVDLHFHPNVTGPR